MYLPKRIFDLYYGQPASGKSEAIRKLIEYILSLPENRGKRFRVCIGDGSLLTYDSLIERGLVEAMEFSYRPWPFDVSAKLAQGWWPKDSDDPMSPLVAPTPDSLHHVIGYVFEGASVMGAYLMGDIQGGLAYLGGQGIKIGQDSPIQVFQGVKDSSGKLIEGPGTTTGGNAMAHYNVAQRAIVGAVQRSKGLAKYVIWTAHEATNDPEKNTLVKELQVGPEVVGKALTVNFQRLFNNTFHFQSVGKRTREKDDFTGKDAQDLELDYRIYTQDHFSPDNNTTIRYKAVTRGVRGLHEHYGDVLDLYREIYQKMREGVDNAPSPQVD